MGCTNSKSTPIADSNNFGCTDSSPEKSEEYKHRGFVADMKEFASNIEHKVESLIDKMKVKQEPNDANNENGELSLSDKPPTPMPEAVINNAIWPDTVTEPPEKPSEEVAKANSLDVIEEEKRYNNLTQMGDDGAVIQILTIEISEIPIVDDGVIPREQANEKSNKKDTRADNKTKKNIKKK